MAVKVSKHVLDGLEVLRECGAIEILDEWDAIVFAEITGYNDTAEWIEANSKQYAKGKIEGFEVEGDKHNDDARRDCGETGSADAAPS